jgi:predicted kinase
MKPTAVVIGGTHGAGKSTLGELLSQRLGWPLISRDRIRGGLAWTTGEPEHEAGGELSRRAVAVFFETLLGLTKASVSVVAESPFRRGLSEADMGVYATNRGTRPLILVAAGVCHLTPQ